MVEQAFVISDLHLGGGAAEPELESFLQDAELAAFIDSLPTAGTTLFINGDFVDFLKIPPYEVPDPDHLLWTEEASLAKIRAAVTAHPVCFDALARFAAEGKLRILVGNHDLDLAWPGVQDAVRGTLGDPAADRLRFTIGAETYHGVHIEHGHAFTAENSPDDPESFIHRWPAAEAPAPELYLERVWGADFVLSVVNHLEREFPFADKVKPRLTLVYYGLRNGWVSGRQLVRLLLFLKRRKVPREILFSAVAAAPEPDFQSVVDSFGSAPWRSAIRDRGLAEPRFSDQVEAAIRDLSPADRQILARRVEIDVGAPQPAEASEVRALGLIRDRREVRAARDRLARPGVTHVVFGHTHGAVDGELDGALYNPGSWVPHLNLRSPDVRQKVERDGVTTEVLQDRSLWRVERRAVHIRPDSAYRARVELIEV